MKTLILCVMLLLAPVVSANDGAIILIPNAAPITKPSMKPTIIIKKRLFSRIIIINGVRIRVTRPLFRRTKRVLPIEQPKAIPMKVNGAIPIPWDSFLPVSLEYYS